MTPYTINVKTLIFSKRRLKLFLKYGYIQSHHYSNILTYLVFLEPPVCLSQVFVWRMENWFPTSKMTQEIPCLRLTSHPTMPSSPQCHLRIGRQSATIKTNISQSKSSYNSQWMSNSQKPEECCNGELKPLAGEAEEDYISDKNVYLWTHTLESALLLYSSLHQEFWQRPANISDSQK